MRHKTLWIGSALAALLLTGLALYEYSAFAGSEMLFVVNRHGEILEQVLYATNPEGLVDALKAALEQQA